MRIIRLKARELMEVFQGKIKNHTEEEHRLRLITIRALKTKHDPLRLEGLFETADVLIRENAKQVSLETI